MRTKPKIEPFRFWWAVTYSDERGEYDLLFKRRQRAEEFAQKIEEGASWQELHDLARQRLR